MFDCVRLSALAFGVAVACPGRGWRPHSPRITLHEATV
jgi:hypothetical protein